MPGQRTAWWISRAARAARRAAVVWWCLAASAAAETSSSERPLIPLGGDRLPATLISISDQGELEFRAARTSRRLPLDGIVAWGAPNEPRSERQLVLSGGGILTVRRNPPPMIQQDKLLALSDTFGELKLPLNRIAGVMLHAPIDPQRRDQLANRLRGPPAESEPGEARLAANTDRLLLENGDELRGRIVALTESAVEFEADLGPFSIESERVAALAFNPLLRARTPENDRRVLVGFADGSVLVASSIQLDSGQLRIGLHGLSAPLVADEGPVFLQPLGRDVQYLSDLAPASYRHLPYLSLSYGHRLDANVTGTRLRARGKIYLKGVGMHSAARLTWQLAKPYRRFEADLAIDDQAHGRGSVVFRVFSASREIFKSPLVRGGDEPRAISVDIRETRQLSLVVDYADFGDMLDYADWLNARLTP